MKQKFQETEGFPRQRLNDFDSWPINKLTEYLAQDHREYFMKQAPALKSSLSNLCSTEGDKQPILCEMSDTFERFSMDLSEHMKKEESVLFPLIRKMVKAHESRLVILDPKFHSIIESILNEHKGEGKEFRKISQLAGKFTPPVKASKTCKDTFSMLIAFMKSLQRHIEVENNILMPKSIELERKSRQ